MKKIYLGDAEIFDSLNYSPKLFRHNIVIRPLNSGTSSSQSITIITASATAITTIPTLVEYLYTNGHRDRWSVISSNGVYANAYRPYGMYATAVDATSFHFAFINAAETAVSSTEITSAEITDTVVAL
jgi:hypothetical protein